MSSLYLPHFGLNKPPFQITPDLDCFFSGGRRGEILSALLHVAAHDEGICMLVAEVGSGKTLLARLMISRLGPGISAVYLANPCFSRDEIIVAIARDLGLLDLQGSMESKLAALQRELLRRHAGGQRVLLVIDEAHAMPAESLEEVRLLSNLETGRHKLVNIVLFGQPELDVLLALPMLRQVQDRITHRFSLQALRKEESSAYVEHRLRAAGWHGGQLLAPAALACLIKASDGRARRINLLADKALLAAYAQGARRVELEHVKSAVRELPRLRIAKPDRSTLFWRVAAGSAVCAVVAVAAWAVLAWYPVPAVVPTPVAAIMRKEPLVAVTFQEIQTPAASLALDEPLKHASAVPIPPTPVAPQASAPTAPVALPAAAPESKHFDAVVTRTQQWLQQENLNGFTVQLAIFNATDNPNDYLQSVLAQLPPTQVFASQSMYKAALHTSVFYGSFTSFADAARAIENLPAALRGNKPSVRSWVKIKMEQTS